MNTNFIITGFAALAIVVAGAMYAGSASADTRHCYTPHVAGFDTYEVCYFLPIEPTA